MPEWLTDAVPTDAPIPPTMLAVRLLLALVFGGVVAALYRCSHGRDKVEAHAMGTTLVLLAVLIAMVSLVIGNSVARAFSLVGALSIVRFRTVVEDTRDTAFVIFAVIVGMACGVGQFVVALVGVPVIALAAIGFGRTNDRSARAASTGTLSVRLGLGRSPDELLSEVLQRHAHQFRVVATSTAKQGAAFDVTYSVQLRSDAAMTQMVSELNQIEGVLSVELRR